MNVAATVNFDGSASAPSDGAEIVSYTWNFQDGNTGEGVRPSHAYSEAGTFDVTLTVVDSTGASASDTVRIIVRADTTSPEITHTAIESAGANQPLPVSATVTDEDGTVASVTLRYRLASSAGDFRQSSMNLDEGDTYTRTIPRNEVTGDIEYYIVARDASDNQARYPAGTDTFVVTVGGPIAATDPAGQRLHEGGFAMTARVADLTDYDAQLRYRASENAAIQAVTASALQGNRVTATVPESFVASNAQFEYQWRVRDTSGDTPGEWQRTDWTAVTPGSAGPGITHTRLDSRTVTKGDGVPVEATVAHPSGVDAVSAFVRSGASGQFTEVALQDAGDGTWTGTLPASVFENGGTGTYGYYLEATATDASTTRLPGVTAFPFTVTVEEPADDGGNDNTNNGGGGSNNNNNNNNGGGSNTPAAPTVTITAPGDGDEVTGAVTITGKATDATSVTVTVSDGTEGTATGTDDWSFEWAPASTVADGTYTITVEATGDGGTATASVDVALLRGTLEVVESEALDVSVTDGPEEGAHVGTGSVVTFAYPEDVPGNATFTVLVNGVDVTDAAAIDNGTVTVPVSETGDVTVTLRVATPDGATGEASRAFIVDVEGPVVTFDFDGGVEVTAGDALAGRVEDGAGLDPDATHVLLNGDDASDRVTVDGDVVSLDTTGLEAGEYTLRVEATDVLGNANADEIVFNVLVPEEETEDEQPEEGETQGTPPKKRWWLPAPAVLASLLALAFAALTAGRRRD